MSSFKEILDNILSNTEVKINKNGIGIKNGNFDVNIPIEQANSSNNTPIMPQQPQISSNDYVLRGTSVYGTLDLFGGVGIVSLFTRKDIVAIDAETLLKKLPQAESTISVDSNYNRICSFGDGGVVILVAEVPCRIYNKYADMYSDPSLGIVRHMWVDSMSNTAKFLIRKIPNRDDCLKQVSDSLLSIESPLCNSIVFDGRFINAIQHLDTYFSEMGRSNIGSDIANCEELNYVPEVPKGSNLEFMRKYSRFFDDKDNLNRCVKLDMMSRLIHMED